VGWWWQVVLCAEAGGGGGVGDFRPGFSHPTTHDGASADHTHRYREPGARRSAAGRRHWVVYTGKVQEAEGGARPPPAAATQVVGYGTWYRLGTLRGDDGTAAADIVGSRCRVSKTGRSFAWCALAATLWVVE